MDCVLGAYWRAKSLRRKWGYVRKHYFNCRSIHTFRAAVSIPRRPPVAVTYVGHVRTGWQLQHAADLARSAGDFLRHGGDPMFTLKLGDELVEVLVTLGSVILTHGGCVHYMESPDIDLTKWAAALFHPRRGCVAKKNCY